MEIGKGIAIAGVWIGCGIASAFNHIAVFSFVFAVVATLVIVQN